MMGLRTVLLAAFYAAAAVNADNACNPIEACEVQISVLCFDFLYIVLIQW